MSDQLYNLLPGIYRQRDLEQGQPLRALLAVIQQQVDALQADTEELYDNWFIETADDWVVPYLGELLGIDYLGGVEAKLIDQRRFVADAISYRRRKGTKAALSEAISAVTGWPALVVEYFDKIGRAQTVRDVRPRQGRVVDVRERRRLTDVDGPFDAISHRVDVRRIARPDCVPPPIAPELPVGQGGHNLDEVGIFLWPLNNYRAVRFSACPTLAPVSGFSFHTLGYATPLRNLPAGDDGDGDDAEGNRARRYPTPITRSQFAEDLAAVHSGKDSAFYGPDRSFCIYVKDDQGATTMVPVDKLVSCDLSHWESPSLAEKQVAVDVQTGRMLFPDADNVDYVDVDYQYAFGGDLGGGTYDRSASPMNRGEATLHIDVKYQPDSTTLLAAFDKWERACKSAGRRVCGLIRIAESQVYVGYQGEPRMLLSRGQLPVVRVPSGCHLVIEAANGMRPVLPALHIQQVAAPNSSTSRAKVTVNGAILVQSLQFSGDLDASLEHCTLGLPQVELASDDTKVPPQILPIVPSGDSSQLDLSISHSVVGPLRFAAEIRSLTIEDSIVDAAGNGDAIAGLQRAPGPSTSFRRATLLGCVRVKRMPEASDSIFNGELHVDDRDTGAARYCFIPDTSTTPPRLRCQPEQALQDMDQDRVELYVRDVLADVRPVFSSTDFRSPAFGQLSPATRPEIFAGAENGSQMGAFNHQYHPQRIANLRRVLEEHLPAGSQAGVFFQD